MRVPISVIVIAFLVAEIAGFVLVGKAIGVLATVGLVLLGMLAGAMLIRQLGLEALRRLRTDINTGKANPRLLADGAVLAFGALLILVPGFLSDLIGIALLVPAVRRLVWRSIKWRLEEAPGRVGAARGERVVDLDRSEYGTAAEPRVQANSPWRQEGSGP